MTNIRFDHQLSRITTPDQWMKYIYICILKHGYTQSTGKWMPKNTNWNTFQMNLIVIYFDNYYRTCVDVSTNKMAFLSFIIFKRIGMHPTKSIEQTNYDSFFQIKFNRIDLCDAVNRSSMNNKQWWWWSTKKNSILLECCK